MVKIEGPEADLLIDLSAKRFVPSQPEFALVRGGNWGGVRLNHGRLVLEGSALKLLVPIEGSLVTFWDETKKARNQPAALELADGSTLLAGSAAMLRSSGGEGEIRLLHWEWNTAASPFLWFARLDGHVPSDGNLSLPETNGQDLAIWEAGYRLDGYFTWYVLRGDNARHQVVIVPHGAGVNCEQLARDFRCMELVFGSRLDIDLVTGLTMERRPVAAFGLSRAVGSALGHRCPVPDELPTSNTHVWLPELFRLLSAKIQAGDVQPLITAIASYTDAAGDHLDGAYMKAQVGLEAFSERLVGRASSRPLVQDIEKWKTFVAKLRRAVERHLGNPTPSDPRRRDRDWAVISGKFISAGYQPTGELVEKAFKSSLGSTFQLPKELKDEIGLRNRSVHTYWMNILSQYEIDRDYRRVEMIQTMLVALVACYIGYRGPIKGYDFAPDGRRSPDWWPVSLPPEDVSRRYVGERVMVGQ
jgi:hypothetical protein